VKKFNHHNLIIKMSSRQYKVQCNKKFTENEVTQPYIFGMYSRAVIRNYCKLDLNTFLQLTSCKGNHTIESV